MTEAMQSLIDALRRAADFIELIADEGRKDDDAWAYDRAEGVLDAIRPVLDAHGDVDTVPDDPEPHESVSVEPILPGDLIRTIPEGF